MTHLFDVDLSWYSSNGAYIWQQSICWTFILLAGFCWNLSKNHSKRGLLSLSGGALISLITHLILPSNPVRFGILTLIGSCILFWILLDTYLNKVPSNIGTIVCFVLFISTKLWLKHTHIYLLDADVSAPVLNSLFAYIGFPEAKFTSSDYFALIPWSFLFATGYYLYLYLNEKNLNVRLFGRGKINWINFLGRHSFAVYMLHQPICYAFAYMFANTIS